MASSEVRALGTLSKFAGAFEKAGGEFKMFNWLAEDPEMMREVVRIGNRRFLEYETRMGLQYRKPMEYDPIECFSPGEHYGVRIATIDALFVMDRTRSIRSAFLSVYRLRRQALLSDVYQEMGRLEIEQKMTVDHLWAALLYHKQERQEGAFLAMDGTPNMFNLLLRDNWYFPVSVRLDEVGWHIATMSTLTPGIGVEKGTRFIMNDAG